MDIANHHRASAKKGVLTEEQVRRVKKSLREGQDDKELSILFGVSKQTIARIRLGETWGWVKEEVDWERDVVSRPMGGAERKRVEMSQARVLAMLAGGGEREREREGERERDEPSPAPEEDWREVMRRYAGPRDGDSLLRELNERKRE